MEMFHFLFIILLLLHVISGDQISNDNNEINVNVKQKIDKSIKEIKMHNTDIDTEKEEQVFEEIKVEAFATPEPEVVGVDTKTSSASVSDFITTSPPPSISSSLTWKDVMEAWGKGIYNAMEPLFVRKTNTDSNTNTNTHDNDNHNNDDNNDNNDDDNDKIIMLMLMMMMMMMMMVMMVITMVVVMIAGRRLTIDT